MPNTTIEEKKEVIAPVKAEKKPEKKEVKEEVKPKKPRARKAEELILAATKGMTDKEKAILIDYLKNELAMSKTKIDLLKANADAAYAKIRQAEADYEAMENYYKAQLGFVDTQVRAFAQAVTKATVGGTH